jgi:hypothetical protein
LDEQNTILKTARAKDKSIRKEDVDVECFLERMFRSRGSKDVRIVL